MTIRATRTLVALMQSAIMVYAHASLNTKGILIEAVALNVSSTRTVPVIRLVYETNVLIRALEPVDKMHYVKSSTTFLCAVVRQE